VEQAARHVAAEGVGTIDLRHHDGIHPRLGAVDVVPFVPLPGGASMGQALAARDRFTRWAGMALALPCFRYGPERTLPEVRRHAFHPLRPDAGPATPHPTAGATAVGARPVLVAYNVWITEEEGTGHADHDHARAVAHSVAASLRSPAIRALGLPVAVGAQVSVNLLEPGPTSISDLYDAVADRAGAEGCRVLRAELVGLVPAEVVRSVPARRRRLLDVSEDRTIEARLSAIQ
jgi:glutamate formiminotransferase